MRIDERGQSIQARKFAHQLPETYLDREALLQLQGDLGQHQAVQPEFHEVRIGIRVGQVETRHVLEQVPELRDQARTPVARLLLHGRWLDGGWWGHVQLRLRGNDARQRHDVVRCGDGIDPETLAFERIGRQPQAPAHVAPIEHAWIERDALRPQLARGQPDACQLSFRVVSERCHAGYVVFLDAGMLARQRAQGGAWPYFQQDARGRAKHLAQCRRKPHGLTKVGSPVIRRSRPRCIEPVAGRRRNDGDARSGQLERRHFRTERRNHGVHHLRVEGVRRPQRPAGDAIGFEQRLESRDRLQRARHDAIAGRIFRRQRQVCGEPRKQLVQRQPHGQHAAGRLCLHQRTAARDQPQRIRQGENPGQRRSHEFTDAVADHCLRHDAVAHPPLGQGIFDRERRRLHDRSGQQRFRIVGKNTFAQVESEFRAQGVGAIIERHPEGGLRFIQVAPHARIGRALPREQEHHIALSCRKPARGSRGELGAAELCDRIVDVGGDHGDALGESLAADGERPGHIGEVGIRLRFEVVGQLRGGVGERRGGARRQHQQIRTARRFRCRQLRRFFHHHMGVGSAHAERTHAGPARRFRQGPLALRSVDHERRRGEVDGRVGCIEMQAGRNALLGQRESGLDDAGGAGGDHQVADVALHRSDPAEPAVIGRATEGPCQSFDLDRISHWRGGAVGFDITDGARIDLGAIVGHCDHCRLPFAAGCGKAGLAGAVVVDGAAAENGEHLVTVGDRIGQTLEQHDRGAIAEDRALRIGSERPRMAVGRQHCAFLVEITTARRTGHGDSTGQRHVAMTEAQAVHRLADRHQRCRAGRVHADRGTGEVEFVRDARGDEILLVVQHHLEGADLVDQVRTPGDVALEVAGIEHPGEYADRARCRIGNMAAPLQAFPRQFKEDPLLRVHQFGFLRANAEERCIELLDALDHAPRLHIGRIVALLRADGGIEVIGAEHRDRIAALAQIAPERLNVLGPWKTTGHRNDGDGLGCDLAVGAVCRREALGFDPGAFTPFQRRGKRRRGGIAEQERCRNHAAGFARTLFADLLQQARREQRVAPQIEEVVVPADIVHRKQVAERSAQVGFHRPYRRLVGIGQLGALPRGCRKRATIELAVLRQGQRLEFDEGAGNHVIRQRRREVRAQRCVRCRCSPGHDVGHQSCFAASAVVARDHCACAHGWVAGKNALDLTRLDAETADLHLVVAAAQVFEVAIRKLACEVSGLVEAQGFAGGRLPLQEPFGRQFRTVEIATRHTGAGHVDFADFAHRDGHEARVEHEQAQVRDGFSDDAAGVALEVSDADRAVGDVDGGFGDPIHVDQLRMLVAMALEPGKQHLQFERFPAKDHVSQRQRGRCDAGSHIGMDQVAERRGRLVQHGDAFAYKQSVEHLWRAGVQVRDHDDAAAMDQGTPYLPHRKIEGVGMEERPHVLWPEPEPVAGRGEQARDVGVRDLAALRLSGRTGGVNHIGEIVRLRQRHRIV